MYLLLSSFLAADVPNPQPDAPSEIIAKTDTVLGLLAWLGTAAAVLGIVTVAIKMAGSLQKGDAEDHIGSMLTVLVGCVLLSTAGPLVNFVL
ncbi:hypothetical protein SAMN04487983_102177 [Streptomyces sp. yr375]|uniref:hypothetical protein n=1 Tax=Streptomyces sp. yr375 TaxID=1761906 RepID=UPI0008C97B0B|nr:hypothetical protein [Streptomyces sp. yr375]SER74555.1 hypothetical protein SAMN04487983_102177 [Streptomyces sp. yr375]